MKTLFVGDIHTKTEIIEEVEKLIKEDKDIGKVIFVGDYVDDWKAVEKDNINVLNRIFDLKDSYSDKVHLLVGNHEFSYLGYPCSGHIYSKEVPKILLSRLKDLDVIYKTDDYTVSHGGITSLWLSNLCDYYKEENIDKIIDKINDGFHNQDMEIYRFLSLASFTSGSNSYVASCLWARPSDHISGVYGPIYNYTQIAGHTPIPDPVFSSVTEINNSRIYYIDTFSTYYNTKESIGKREVLIFDEDTKEFSTIKLFKEEIK